MSIGSNHPSRISIRNQKQAQHRGAGQHPADLANGRTGDQSTGELRDYFDNKLSLRKSIEQRLYHDNHGQNYQTKAQNDKQLLQEFRLLKQRSFKYRQHQSLQKYSGSRQMPGVQARNDGGVARGAGEQLDGKHEYANSRHQEVAGKHFVTLTASNKKPTYG